MATTNFTSGTVVASSWLNDVNRRVYSDEVWITESQFGYSGSGTISATVFQNAINAVQGTSTTLMIPGNVTISLATTPISITNSITIRCVGGRARSAITWSSTTMVAIVVNTPNQIHIEGLSFNAPASCTAGGAIQFSGSGAGNFQSTIKDCAFSGGWIQVDTQSAYGWNITNCYFTGFVQFGVNVKNSVSPDSGDSYIGGNCIFANASTALACINHESSGGLKIIGNKFNTAQYSYRLQLVGTTSDLVFSGNSCENYTVGGMGFFWTSGAFNNITISGNQFALGPSAILMNSATAFFSYASICGNVITSQTGYGIVVNNASGLSISGNTIAGTGGATVAGIYLDTGVTGLSMGPNKITGFTTSITNLSTNGNIVGYTRPVNIQTSGTAAPADLNENILFTAKLPAATLGTAGAIKLYLAWAHTANANVKTLRVRLGGIGGTVIWSAQPGATSASTTRTEIVCGNTGATNSQISTAITQIDAVIQNVGAISSAIDTSVATTIVVTCQKATAGDSIVLQNAVAEAITMV